MRCLSTAASVATHAPFDSPGGDGDTVYALSSGMGKAGVAVIRVSGPGAADVLRTMTAHVRGRPQARDDAGGRPSSAAAPRPCVAVLKPRYAWHCQVVHPTSGEALDEGIALFFPGPNSFTGEDVAELQVHGSHAVVADVLDALASLPGVRAAEQGEFTRRAFDNQRMDLTEVEALADLLAADTSAQRRQALRQLGGALSSLYDGWRRTLMECLAHTEAVIDFGEDEDDCNDAVYDAVGHKVAAVVEVIRAHLADGRRGEIVRQGIGVAIVGPPNAGKSSLLNTLARRPAAIVSDIPGTTRDVIEVSMDLGGLPVVLSDTAGLRVTDDAVEHEGVLRARARVDESDVQVCVLDVNTFPEVLGMAGSADLRQLVLGPGEGEVGGQPASTLLVLNKSDLLGGNSEAQERVWRAAEELGLRGRGRRGGDSGGGMHLVSCTTMLGIDGFVGALEALVQRHFADHSGTSDAGALITRARHREQLVECVACLDRFLEQPPEIDIAAEELRLAVQCIGRITGRVDVEELLDIIFADFCIGK